ncbi:MAG: hypothetical protein E7437_01615 [Ruminococcaceae bacterium]|nr:hypothetical protein [Oscillospiraceae bacterium]
MRRLYVVGMVLVMLLLLTSCGDSSASSAQPTEPSTTEPTTVVTTEETTQPTEPSTEPTVRPMDAKNLFWKMKYVTTERANQYKKDTKMRVRVGQGGYNIWMDVQSVEEVSLCAYPAAANVLSQTKINYMDIEIDQQIATYYRKEDGKMVMYLVSDQLGIWERVEMPEMSGTDLVKSLTEETRPERPPEDLTLQEQTVMYGNTEVYVLQYTESVGDFLGYSGDPELDEVLEWYHAPVMVYVDAQTYLPLCTEMIMEEVPPDVSEYLTEALNFSLPEELQGYEIKLGEVSMSYTDMVYGPVELDSLPDAPN